MDAVNSKPTESSKPQKFIVRISNAIPPPPEENKTRDLAKIIDATTGLAEISGSDQKIINEAARKLWRHGTDPEKLENAIKRSSATLSAKDKDQLLQIAGEIKKLINAYPKTSNNFLSQNKPDDAIEITNASDTTFPKNNNEIVMEKSVRGIQVSPIEYQIQNYNPEDLKESEVYLDNFSEYAQNVDLEDSGSDYEETDSYIPSPQPSRTSSREPSSPVSGNVREALSRGQNVIVNRGKELASKALNQFKTSAGNAVKQGLSKLASSAAPALAHAGLYVGAAIGLLVGFFVWLATVIITVILWMIGFVVFVVIVLFIINSGAYIVPPGENLTTSVGGIPAYTGDVPEECPSGWPILPFETETSLYITQGPDGAWSHYNAEAIDVGATVGHEITARHTGIVHRSDDPSSPYGCFVDLESVCNGRHYYSRYAHLTITSVSDGQEVVSGQMLGLSGGAAGDPCQGNSTGPHLHYEFRDGIGVGGNIDYETEDPPYMEYNYNWLGTIFNFIPKYVPRGCSSAPICQTTIP